MTHQRGTYVVTSPHTLAGRQFVFVASAFLNVDNGRKIEVTRRFHRAR